MSKSFVDKSKKTLLTPEEMATLERNLTFQPAAPDTATSFSADQIATFNQDGFLLPLPLFDSQEIADYRRYFDHLLEETLAAGGDSYSIIDAHTDYGKLYDLIFHPKLIAYATDLIGPDLAVWATHFFCKLPHDDKQVSWHQDAYYWPFTPARTVTAWLAIDDADPGNACMQFVKGSHRIGPVAHRVSRGEEKNVLRVAVDGVETFGEIANVALQAGQVSLHSDMLLHGSGANMSDRRRCGLTIRYIDANATDLKDWSKIGVMVHGEDYRGQWGNPPRPARD